MEINRFNNFDFRLEEADKILIEANRIFNEVLALGEKKSEALELFNEH